MVGLKAWRKVVYLAILWVESLVDPMDENLAEWLDDWKAGRKDDWKADLKVDWKAVRWGEQYRKPHPGGLRRESAQAIQENTSF